MAVEVKVRPEVWHKSAAEELVSPTPFPTLSGVKDVTNEVRVDEMNEGMLPVTRCLCGAEWYAWQGPILCNSLANPYECPECHVKLFFSNAITVYALAETVPLAPECDCYDVHANLDLTEASCGCPCHKPLDRPEDPEYTVDIHGDLDVK